MLAADLCRILLLPVVAGLLLTLLILYFVDGHAVPAVRLALAVTVALLVAVLWERDPGVQVYQLGRVPVTVATVGPPPDRRPGSRAARGLGWLVFASAWVAVAMAFGAMVFWLTGPKGQDDLAFQPRIAALMAAVILLGILCNGGYQLAGFVVDWDYLRGVELARTAVGAAVLVAAAGYKDLLEHLGWVVFTWTPVHLFRLLQDWWHTGWLSILLSVLLAPVWLTVYSMVGHGLVTLTGLVFGEENPLGEIVRDLMPAGLGRFEG